MTLFAKAAKQLYEEQKNIHFHLYRRKRGKCLRTTGQRAAGFCRCSTNVDLSKYLYLNLPFQDTWGLIMRKDSPLVSKVKIPMEDLIGLPLIVSRQGTTNEMPEWLQKKLRPIKYCRYL